MLDSVGGRSTLPTRVVTRALLCMRQARTMTCASVHWWGVVSTCVSVQHEQAVCRKVKAASAHSSARVGAGMRSLAALWLADMSDSPWGWRSVLLWTRMELDWAAGG